MDVFIHDNRIATSRPVTRFWESYIWISAGLANSISSKVITSIFGGVLRGEGLKEIAKNLNHVGIAGPKGKSWSKTTLHKILTNEAYTGTLIWGRTSSRNTEPIVVEFSGQNKELLP